LQKKPHSIERRDAYFNIYNATAPSLDTTAVSRFDLVTALKYVHIKVCGAVFRLL